MDFAPGDGFKYNNSGYISLSHIVESVTGQTYGQFLKEALFEMVIGSGFLINSQNKK